jgi:3-hydroxyisobutyrate dehydrogenase-like beta-hydroxyacid dehydrogenase
LAELAFIGLGRMGKHMARNLMKGGHTVTVYNRSQGAVQELVAAGARAAASPAAAAASADVLFTCLTTPEVVEATLLAAAEGARPGAIFVDHSTIGRSDAIRISEKLAARGVRFLDAPVSGGPWGAEAGTLTIMVGGDPETFAAVKPYLDLEGKPDKVLLMGPVGAGSVVKLCNNLLVAINTAGLAEAFVLGTKAGVDPVKLYEVISGATGNSAMLTRNMPGFIFPGKFDAAFSVGHLHKDVMLANNLGRDLQVRMLLGAIVQQVLEETRAAGFTEQDITAMIRPLESLAGVEVRAELPAK